jgi:hypothetical protein
MNSLWRGMSHSFSRDDNFDVFEQNTHFKNNTRTPSNRLCSQNQTMYHHVGNCNCSCC